MGLKEITEAAESLAEMYDKLNSRGGVVLKKADPQKSFRLLKRDFKDLWDAVGEFLIEAGL